MMAYWLNLASRCRQWALPSIWSRPWRRSKPTTVGPAVPKTDLVVGAAEGCFARAVAFARAKRSEGLRVVLSYQTDKSKVLAQAENEGAQAVFLEESKGAEQ